MNWLTRTSQIVNVEEILASLLPGGGGEINWAAEQLMRVPAAEACPVIQIFGQAGAAQNSIASKLMRYLGCQGSPDSPAGQDSLQQQQQQQQPMQMPAIGEQEKPMDVPSTEII